jgi:hypothetical protein
VVAAAIVALVGEVLPASAAATTFKPRYGDPVMATSSCTAPDVCTVDPGSGTLTISAQTSVIDMTNDAKAGFKVAGLLPRRPGAKVTLQAKLDITSVQVDGYPQAYANVHLTIEQGGWLYHPSADCTSQVGACTIEAQLDSMTGPFDFGVEAEAHAAYYQTGECIDRCHSASLTVRVLEFSVR